MRSKQGYYSPAERWGEHNLEFYRDVYRHNGIIGCGVKDALGKLEFFERFDPSVPHDRTVAHALDVYLLQEARHDIRRTNKGTFLLMDWNPLFGKKKVLSLDLGVLLEEMSIGAALPEGIVKYIDLSF